MFDAVSFDKEVNNLIREGQRDKAEERLLRARSELKLAGSIEDLEYVVSRLARFYSTPGAENLEKAEAYFLESEVLLPGAGTKYQTAMFYYYVVQDSQKTVGKVDEIRPPQVVADRGSYYSALTLKGQALIDLERQDHTGEILQALLDLIKANPAGLPYGDEVNLLQAAISNPILMPRCREILHLIIPKIRSQEYVEKAKALLKSISPGYELS